MSEPDVVGGADHTDADELNEDGVKIGLGEENNTFEPEEEPDATPEEPAEGADGSQD
ncbi:hypothetical protein [Pseudactinotalea suaedae]|uniref:hypothetical protein n=1 Tax=Pseudactinotalea suaedae TaxID=1524924 RepID=UPI0012E1597B|nr:hypothetical protein [Pseudactinotalea suaedae]